MHYCLLILIYMGLIFSYPSNTLADTQKNTPQTPTFTLEAKQALLMDVESGTTLYEKNADDPMPPSSMAKMMTLYLVFERLADGRLTLEDRFQVSKRAWQTEGTKMFLEWNSQVRLEDLIRGIAVQSGNDACVAVAEGIANTEEAFAQEMTERAHELGATHSIFTNASGLNEPTGTVSTARDLAIIGIRTLQDFPQYYSYYAEQSFEYNKIRQGNRNTLLGGDLGVDGIKTGHTEAGGFGITASGLQNGRRLIVVINGTNSMSQRIQEAGFLLRWGFQQFENYTIKRDQPLETARVWLSDQIHIPLVLTQDAVITIPRIIKNKLKLELAYETPLVAPLRKGDQVGVLIIKTEGQDRPLAELPVTVQKDIHNVSFLARPLAQLKYSLNHP